MNMLMLLLGSKLAENQGVADRGRQFQIGAIAAAMPNPALGLVMANTMASREAPVVVDDDGRSPVEQSIAELEARKQALDEEDRALAQEQALVEAQLKALKATAPPPPPPAQASPGSTPAPSGTAAVTQSGAMKKPTP